jgi:hypothetical protein
MTTCICSYSTENRKNLYTITNLTKRLYANAHKVDFVFEELHDYDKHPAWYKMDFILKLFEKYDSVYFIDDDAGFIKNDVNLNNFVDKSYDICISFVQSDNMLNTGSFYISNNEKTKSALKYVYTLYDKYKDDPYYEQTAFNDAIKKFNLSVKLLDDKIINCTIYDRTVDTIILHLMGNLKNIVSTDYILRAYNII